MDPAETGHGPWVKLLVLSVKCTAVSLPCGTRHIHD
jgi:hypothetical protein